MSAVSAADSVILVDAADREIGVADKMGVHYQGAMHRAFSVFVFNSRGELLLQRRALDKYHSAGLWSNTCCSHPRPGETVLEAAQRRMPEEMGIDLVLRPVFSFIYHATFENGLVEHELDHVLIGRSVDDVLPEPNPAEVVEWKWVSPAQIRADLHAYPEMFTVWFRLCFERAIACAGVAR
jgi:isopentenyl-diphosphate delta-isomerase